ncbi:jg8817 [Pararge aegeria aegeria]|uniref:Jg8817 protein n=1 Tax=Pararge aegeria aegeria TaxID=348720 RepID=A0A8S4SM55_9NEOP|nr:jg8817 [Pararge aegeria aegeria]
MPYGSESWSLTLCLIRMLRATLRAMVRDGEMLVTSLRDPIRNAEIRRRTRAQRHNSTNREAEVAMGERMGVWVPRCWNGSPSLVSVALVDPQRGGQTISSASQGVAGCKRDKSVQFETP